MHNIQICMHRATFFIFVCFVEVFAAGITLQRAHFRMTSSSTAAPTPLSLWVTDASSRNKEAVESIYDRFPVDAELVNHADDVCPPGDASRTRKFFRIDEKNRIVSMNRSKVLGAEFEIDSADQYHHALALVGSAEYVLVKCNNWSSQYIPIENLVSACTNSAVTKLAVRVEHVDQIPGVAFALQLGADVLVMAPDEKLWEGAMVAFEQRHKASKDSTSSAAAVTTSAEGEPKMCLSHATIETIKYGSIGDRVCIDLIRSLRDGEGALIGSSAKSLALVHGETIPGEFVPARPFRINAGPVHSYILMEDGSTKYLSELEAGDVIAISSLMEPPMRDSDGDKGIQGHWKTRGVTVGRLKVEPRPMVMLGYQSDKGAKGQIFLQQAETVRVIAPRHDACAEGAVIGIEDAPLRRGQGWQALSVTSLAVGQKVFARFTAKGTHIGKQISADVTEK